MYKYPILYTVIKNAIGKKPLLIYMTNRYFNL